MKQKEFKKSLRSIDKINYSETYKYLINSFRQESVKNEDRFKILVNIIRV